MLSDLDMLHDQRPHAGEEDAGGTANEVRDINALTRPPHPSSGRGGRAAVVVSSHRSSTLSLGSELENFRTMRRELDAMIATASTQQKDNSGDDRRNLTRIGEDEVEETNPLAIVPADSNPVAPPRLVENPVEAEVSMHKVKKEEAESKISAWLAAEIAKVNNRFKREDVVISGWESEHVEKATAWLNKVERKLAEKRARAIEKMRNDVARAHRKAEEKRASAEAKRGTKVARVLELVKLMRAVGRPPSKRSFF